MARPFAGVVDAVNILTGNQTVTGLSQAATVVTGTALTIEELDGTDRRKILLYGRSMPFQGVEFGTEQHTKLTYYAGNPVATQQVLGPRDMPTDMSGEWNDRFLYFEPIKVSPGGLELKYAEQCVDFFERLLASGKRLRVQYVTRVRTGVLKEFTPEYVRATDVKWKMKWEWHSRDDRITSMAAPTPDPPSTAFDLWNALNDVAAKVETYTDAMRAFSAGLVSGIAEIGELVGRFVDALSVIDSVLSLPAVLVGSVRALALSISRKVMALIQKVCSRVTSSPPTADAAAEVLAKTSSPLTRRSSTKGTRSARGEGTPGSVSARYSTFSAQMRQIAASAAALRAFVLDQMLRVDDRYAPKPDQVISAPQGTSLYTISRQYYGSPDFAAFLQLANQLPGTIVPAGFQLRIPPPPVGAAAYPQPMSSASGGYDAPPGGVGCP